MAATRWLFGAARRLLAAHGWCAGLCLAIGASSASAATDTAHLTVHDLTGRLTAARLGELAGAAQKDLDGIVAFWATTPRVEEFGKIRVEFDQPRRDIYSAVFRFAAVDGRKTRVVTIFGANGRPQMMVHKLTHAVFPNPDKLIRNMMGIPTEVRLGNPLTFPMCGFGNDEWVLALRRARAYIPLRELGPDHQQWGMSTRGDLPIVVDLARQHAAYAESGSFGTYLLDAHGIDRVKMFNARSRGAQRPWREVFGAELSELEASWLKALDGAEAGHATEIGRLSGLVQANPATACAQAQGGPIRESEPARPDARRGPGRRSR
jgi:hypothetical protein